MKKLILSVVTIAAMAMTANAQNIMCVEKYDTALRYCGLYWSSMFDWSGYGNCAYALFIYEGTPEWGFVNRDEGIFVRAIVK